VGGKLVVKLILRAVVGLLRKLNKTLLSTSNLKPKCRKEMVRVS
jgi:hypothetical protein